MPDQLGSPRTRYIERARLQGWVSRFEAQHGTCRRVVSADGVGESLEAPDGTVALLHYFPSRELDRARTGVILVRRGGYTVGLAEGDQLTAHHGGTRYVQSRTAAGGWSQQRFQRRRANQADELVQAVTEQAAALLGEERMRLEAVVLGGDRRLCADVVADTRLAWLATLPRRELYDLPDPRLAVLHEAVRRAHAVRVTITDAAGPPR